MIVINFTPCELQIVVASSEKKNSVGLLTPPPKLESGSHIVNYYESQVTKN